MTSRSRTRARALARAAATLLLLVAALVVSSRSFAAGADADVTAAVQQVMTDDYPANLGPAKKKLQDALSQCLRKGCSGTVKAQVYIAIGMCASQLGQADEAKTDFTNALQADPNAALPASGVTPTIKTQFDAAKGAGDDSSGPAAADDTAHIPPGWTSADGFKLALEGLQADQAGNLDLCVDKDKKSLAADEQPRTRLHLASCEARNGKLVDALKDAQKALEIGIQKRDAGVMKVARVRVKELIDRIPHVTFVPPPGVSDLNVEFDGRPVPNEALTKKFSIDPGKHSVVANGQVNGFPASFEQEIDVKERELAQVRITLKPQAQGEFITEGQIKCMLAAKSQEDVQKCLPQNRKNLVVHIGTDASGYTDTNHVNVFSPGFNASLVSPTAGWNVSGHYILDIVSAASPDIVSEASPPFHESRNAFGFSGGYKPGLYGAEGAFNASFEPDYISLGGEIAATADLNDKLITPRVALGYSHDQVGRGPNNFINYLNTTSLDAGVTFILTPTSILLVSATGEFERGDQSKPYRYVPMFDPNTVAPFIPTGATIDLVNRVRLPVRPLEQLPTELDRYAVGARYNRRIGNATFRIDERLYVDTWGVKASTTDSRYMVDLSRHLRVWPHVRLHAQTGANFYQLAYYAFNCIVNDPSPQCQGVATGTLILPTYRTGDRELAPMFTVTGGGAARIAIGPPEGDIKYALTLSGDVMYSRFLKSLFETARTGLYGTVAFEVEF